MRWVAADAGLELTDAAIEAVLTQGGGSARDTLSALELMASTGGDVSDVIDLDEFVQAMIDHDPGRVLTAMAHAVGLGRDPRTLTEELVRHLRNGFLSLMAPELVQLPQHRVDQVAAQSQQLGAAALVRAIETLGSALVEMRHAPDPRILVEVALVQLTHDDAAGDLGALTARLERLEQAVKAGGGAAAAGHAVGRRRRSIPVPDGRCSAGGRSVRHATRRPDGSLAARAGPGEQRRIDGRRHGLRRTLGHHGNDRHHGARRVGGHRQGRSEAVRAGAVLGGVVHRSTTARPGTSVSPTPPTARSATEHRGRRRGGTVGGGRVADHDRDRRGCRRRPRPSSSHASRRVAQASRLAEGAGSMAASNAVTQRTGDDSADARARPRPTTSRVDPDELTDAPPEAVLTPIDRLAQAFPGSELVADDGD